MRIPTALLVLALLLSSVPAVAQEPPPPPEGANEAVLQALRDVEDETRPISFRAQIVYRLLSEGDPTALRGLQTILRSDDRSPDLRLAVATGVLWTPGYPGLDAVLELARPAREGEFRARLLKAFHQARSPALARELVRRVNDPAAAEPDRLLAVEMLGVTASRAAAGALVDLWDRGDPVVAPAAQAALFVMLPVPFETPEAARTFLLVDHAGEDMETILRGLAASARDGAGSDPAVRRLEEMAGALVEAATVRALVTHYLGCAESARVRRMGFERLRTYPYAKGGEEAAKQDRAVAVVAVLDLLGPEEDAEVVVALLTTLRSLSATARELEPERTLAVVMARLDSPLPGVPKEAVATLGDLKDRNAIPALCRIFGESGPERSAFRVAVLDALEKLGDGIEDWVLARLSEEDAGEAVTLRLIQLLKNYPEFRDALPVLIRLLQNSEADRIRQESALVLGTLGVRAGDAAAIDALAVSGLADRDPSVRAFSATQLGSAPAVEGKVIGLLRERLKEQETVVRVKTAAAWSLLKLRGSTALPWLASFLSDDEYWKQAFGNYLSIDVLAAGRAGEAETFVRGLANAGAEGRCVEAARRVLDAKDLVWEGPAAGGRARVLILLVRSMAKSRPADALAVLAAEEASVNLAGEAGVRLDLLKAGLTRQTGNPAGAVEMLTKILALEDAPPGVGPEARLELGRAYLALDRPGDAEKAVGPILSDKEFGPEAAKITEAARSRGQPPVSREPAAIVKDLDSVDAEVRKKAIAELAKRGSPVWPNLLSWLDGKSPEALPAALAVLAKITGIPIVYDPEAPEDARKAVLAEVRRRLAGGE